MAYAGNLVRALDLRAGKNSDVVIDRPALTQRAAAAGVPDPDAHWAAFSRQLSDKERARIEREGEKAGKREGEAYTAHRHGW